MDAVYRDQNFSSQQIQFTSVRGYEHRTDQWNVYHHRWSADHRLSDDLICFVRGNYLHRPVYRDSVIAIPKEISQKNSVPNSLHQTPNNEK